MFGFFPAPCGCFSSDDRSVYRAHFCGLCNSLKKEYGLWARLLVNRDATFLSLLGSSLCPEAPIVSHATCCNPLGRIRPLVQTAPHVRYAAAVTVCGLVTKLRDDADDEAGWRGRASQTASILLNGAQRKAAHHLHETGFPVLEVLDAMSDQTRCESLVTQQPMGAARPTRFAYGEIFAHLPQVTGAAASDAAPLRALGANLGELIYCADAWEDHEEDRRKGRFNPFPADIKERAEMAGEIVDRCLEGIATAFQKLTLRRPSVTQRLLLLSMSASTRKKFGMEVRPACLSVNFEAEDNAPLDPARKQKCAKNGRRRWCSRGNCCEGCDCCDFSCCDWCEGCHNCSACDGSCDGCHGCHGCDCGGCDCSCDGCSCGH